MIAYLLHLLVPLGLLVDVLLAFRAGTAGTPEKSILALSSLWIAISLGALILARDRAHFLQKTRRAIASFYVVVITLAVLEVLLRLAVPSTGSTLWKPGTTIAHKMDLSIMPGASETAIFTVNQQGLRGPNLVRSQHPYKIVTVGGSTTQCLALSDSKEWPHRLMQEMNARQTTRPVWVANAGVSGQTSVHHLVLLRTLPILQEADLLIFLIGINDLQHTVSVSGAATQDTLEQDGARFRARLVSGPEHTYPRFRHLQLFELARRAALTLAFIAKYRFQEEETLTEAQMRKHRGSADVVPLPDLRLGLQEYRRRIEAISQECRARNIRCLFLTQPSMFRKDLTPAEQSLFIFGWVGDWQKPRGHLSTADEWQALEEYNQTLLDACRNSGLECYDLASVLPRNTSAFYDEVHFNEGGAAIVGRSLANYLLASPPFSMRNATSTSNKK